MSLSHLNKVFIGGYTKSGTTFIGRAFDILKGVTARGELDYFRIFCEGLNPLLKNYSFNIQVVNKEVYDGFGSLKPATNAQVRTIHQTLFQQLFFNGEAVPEDIHTLVEKSPRNIFHLNAIRFVFPGAKFVCVFRDPTPVFKSLMRHMSDHRNQAFLDPGSTERQKFFESFVKHRWKAYADIIDKNREWLHLVRYDSAAKDTAGFVNFAAKEILGIDPELKAPIETLSKKYYLANLPEDVRKKSLVQTRSKQIELSEFEQETIYNECRIPSVSFDF